jgi:hypothetical protein
LAYSKSKGTPIWTAWRSYLTTVINLEIEANASGVSLSLFKNIADTLKPLLKAKLYQ